MICDNCGTRVRVLDDDSLWCPVCDWKGFQGVPDPVCGIARLKQGLDSQGSRDLVNQKIVPSEKECKK